MIKYGELTEDSFSDDDPSKKAKFVEQDGFKVLSKEAEEIKTIPVKHITSVDWVSSGITESK